MQFISQKDINNKPIVIVKINDKKVFMSISNQINVTKQIYLLHKSNSGVLGYLYFKGIVPQAMSKWISTQMIPDHQSSECIVDYLNKMFIRKHSELYEFKTNDNIQIIPDNNVYRGSAIVTSYEGDRMITQEKKYKDLLASDYGSIDVWAEETTEYSDADMRYSNKIPFWRTTVHARHYDKSNDGFRSNVERSSLGNSISGYGDAFADLQNRTISLYDRYKDVDI